MPDLDELAGRLEAIAEDLADAALDRLRRNADAVAAGEASGDGHSLALSTG